MTTTPTVLSSAAGTATWRSRRQDVESPPSNRIAHEADDADAARELGVVERDPARPVGAEQHAEREERHERRDTRA